MVDFEKINNHSIFKQKPNFCGESCLIAASSLKGLIRTQNRDEYLNYLDMLISEDIQRKLSYPKTVRDLKVMGSILGLTGEIISLNEFFLKADRESFCILKIVWGVALEDGLPLSSTTTIDQRHFVICRKSFDSYEIWDTSFNHLFESHIISVDRDLLVKRNSLLRELQDAQSVGLVLAL